MKYPKTHQGPQAFLGGNCQVMEETLQLEAVAGSKIATSMTEHFLRRHRHGGISPKNDSNSTRRIIALLELPLSFRQSARQMRVLLLPKKTNNMKLEVEGVFER